MCAKKLEAVRHCTAGLLVYGLIERLNPQQICCLAGVLILVIGLAVGGVTAYIAPMIYLLSISGTVVVGGFFLVLAFLIYLFERDRRHTSSFPSP